jgi:lysophospholipase L1-like esterase
MLFGMPIASEAQAKPHRCVAPPASNSLGQTLSRTAALLSAGRPLRIIALGSSSTAGAGASSPARSYPARLEAELRARFPRGDIVVLNRGVNGEDAPEMLARLDDSVLAERPDLVLWQVGTNAVLKNRSPAVEAPLIRQGLDRLQAAGADVVLIDAQYSPEVIAKPDAEPMAELLATLARERHTGLFQRFAIMRHWREAEHIPFASFVSEDGLHMNDWGYACIAHLLADAIADAAATPTQTASAATLRQL